MTDDVIEALKHATRARGGYALLHALVTGRQIEPLRKAAKDYNPDEPRIPGGQTGGGEWTSGEDDDGGNKGDEGDEHDSATDDLLVPIGQSLSSSAATAQSKKMASWARRPSRFLRPLRTAVMARNCAMRWLISGISRCAAKNVGV
jgi:hypothetical protein